MDEEVSGLQSVSTLGESLKVNSASSQDKKFIVLSD